MNSLKTASYVSTPDGKIISCNSAFADVLGFSSADEVIEHNAVEFYLEKEKRAALLNVLKQNKNLELFEEQLSRKDGKLIDIIESVVGKFDDNGNLVEINSIIFDNTERKKAEQKQIAINRILSILNRQNHWRQLVKDILKEIKSFTGIEAIGIRLIEGEDYPYFETIGFNSSFVEAERYLCRQDKNGNILCNIDGKPYLECICGNVISGRTDQSLSFFTKAGSFWSNNATKIFALTSEKDFKARIRKYCCEEGYESVAFIPVYSADKIIGLLQFNDKCSNKFTLDMILFLEEIASAIGIAFMRMQAEKKISESEERFRSLYENATLGLYRTTPDGKVLIANPALIEMLGFLSFEELAECDVSTGYIDNQNRKKFKTIIEEEGIVYGFESKWKKKNGEIIWIRESAKAIKDENGKIIYYEGTVEDISEIKKVELDLISAREKAEEANRLKTGFLSAISHEIRTPLNVIVGYTEVLKDLFYDPSNPELSMYFTAIGKSCSRLLNTITQILDLSKIEANDFDVKITPLLINSIIESVYHQMKGIAKDKKLEIDLRLPKTSVFVLADDYCINGVLMNLLNNAVKYSEKGTIILDLNIVNNYAICTIADEGIGISDKYQKHLFETFSQEGVGYSRPYEGIGLGLALTKRYIDLMNGKIKIDSKKGIGTKVSFSLPIAPASAVKNNSIQQLTENKLITYLIIL
jgi:PAS domain S-box-containing protein